ncbi:D-alanyl-D-alanine carboxypeptidase [Rhodoblastus acidophilus]|uniref:hypothetical protein n=1 Tax=Rhodoblastus acidophilus TaxID=1074 RepID=UPI0022244C3D|nr:hypothetical protein [Rhodoblastus acidophilus]MCW2284911.1 D-alanyl-D-alanine carboxypeptidase [Rhodoblastus acidophilus]MCW2333799.1 D-alanyl-D-alanine carboxypeptidase [Rhodoblastus acidophilus]
MTVAPVSIRRKPTGPPTSTDTPMLLRPAIRELRQAQNGVAAMAVFDGLPKRVCLEAAAFMVQRPALFAPDVISTALKLTGFKCLAHKIGATRAHAAFARFIVH